MAPFFFLLFPFFHRSSPSGPGRKYTLQPSEKTDDGQCMGRFVHWDGGLTTCHYPDMRCPNCWDMTPEQEQARKERQEAEDAKAQARMDRAHQIVRHAEARFRKERDEKRNPSSSSTGNLHGLVWDPAPPRAPKPTKRKRMTPNQREQMERSRGKR